MIEVVTGQFWECPGLEVVQLKVSEVDNGQIGKWSKLQPVKFKSP